MEKVHTFEEESVEDMKRETEKKNLSSNDERIHRTAERTDAILHRVSHLTELEVTLKDEIRELEHKVKTMDSRHKETLAVMMEMNNKLSKLLFSNPTNFGGSGSDGGGGNGGNAEPLLLDKKNSLPAITITVDGPTPIGSRRTSGQYLKRDSITTKAKKKEEQPTVKAFP
uniref:Uncharacterized protein n=1 Tax=Caenorhabditis japonica TaxID=281687 RepID=A0A8R1EGW1_CAEJA